MKQTVTVAICLLVLGVFATSTFAGSALGLLRGYEDNTLEDEDYEAFTYYDAKAGAWQGVDLSSLGLPAGFYAVPQVGGVLLSMWNVQSVQYSGSSDVGQPTTNTFTAIAATKVASVTTRWSDPNTGEGSWVVAFAPLSLTEWASLTGATGFLPAAAMPKAAGTFGTMFDDGMIDNVLLAGKSWIHPDIDEGVTENDGAPVYHPEDWKADFTTALGTKLWEFGFTGTNGVAQNGEYWAATVTNDNIAGSSVTFQAGLNETYAHIAHPDLLFHDQFSFVGNWLYQFELSGNIPYSTLAGDGFYKTDTDIAIKPTPEPASLALLALGLAAFGGVAYRRRRNR